MNQVSTTKLSSKGQIVIPEDIRNKMKLHSGDQFLVFADNDVVILKTITKPNIDEYKTLIANARLAAKKSGMTKKDVESMIKAVRKK